MNKKAILIASTLVAGFLLTGCGDAEITVHTGGNVRTSQKAPVKSSSTSTVKSSSTGAVKSSSTSTAKSSANSTSKAKNEDRHQDVNDDNDHWAGCNYSDDEPEADPNDEYYYQYHDDDKRSSSVYSYSQDHDAADDTYTHDTNTASNEYHPKDVATAGQEMQEDN